MTELQDPIDRASQNVELAVADFIIAVLAALTVDECLRLRERLAAHIASMEAVELTALLRADSLCGPLCR